MPGTRARRCAGPSRTSGNGNRHTSRCGGSPPSGSRRPRVSDREPGFLVYRVDRATSRAAYGSARCARCAGAASGPPRRGRRWLPTPGRTWCSASGPGPMPHGTPGTSARDSGSSCACTGSNWKPAGRRRWTGAPWTGWLRSRPPTRISCVPSCPRPAWWRFRTMSTRRANSTGPRPRKRDSISACSGRYRSASVWIWRWTW